MNRKRVACLVACAVIAASSVVRAGGGESDGYSVGVMRHQRGPEPEAMEPPPPPPEEMLEHLTRQLKLTVEQRKRIGEVLAQEREQAPILMNKLMEARKQARDAMTGVSVDEKLVRDKATEAARLDVEMAVNHARLRNRISALLTREQRAALSRLPPPAQGHPGKRGMGGEKRCPCPMPPPPGCDDHDGPEGGKQEL